MLGLRYSRRRLRERYGQRSCYGLRAFGDTDLWRQMVPLVLAVFLSSNPQAVYAGTATYDPVFYYYHPDHLGSAQLMTDRAGEVVQHYGYSPYGCERYRANDAAFGVSNRYTGQTLDEDTGLYYYGARYYDPELARFIQPDSTVPDPEFSQAYNRYAYVYNNPLKFSDPTGQNPFLIAMIMGAYMGGFQGAAKGGVQGFFQGAILGAVTGAISAGAGMAVGQLASCISSTVGAVAGSVAGFAASYGVRGAVSGDWHFTTMDAVNLAIAVFSACLEDPRPGAEATLGESNGKQLEKSSGDTGGGGATTEKRDVIVFVNENIQNVGMGSGSVLSQKQALKIGEAIAGKGNHGSVYTFETPADISARLKDLKLDKTADVAVVAHGKPNGKVYYDVGAAFEDAHWTGIASHLPDTSRIHLISCYTAAGKEGIGALARWSAKTGKTFTGYTVKLRYTWRDPHFRMVGDGRLRVAFPLGNGDTGAGEFKKSIKYFWDLYKK